MDAATILASIGLTLLMIIISMYYYVQGKSVGMIEAMEIIKEYEPKAFARMHTKLKRQFNDK